MQDAQQYFRVFAFFSFVQFLNLYVFINFFKKEL